MPIGSSGTLSPKTYSRADRFHAVSAGFLGWTLDAFDFFVVVFLVDTLAAQFGVPKKDIVWTLTATLAMRPLGAVLFGLLADRYGRRIPLMANVIFFSVIELLCGFAPNYSTFLVLRALYGIGMGGEWGVGASLAMEVAPPRWRGVLSGILQSGYPIGYLLAAVAARFVLPHANWRVMFWLGGVPALLALYIRTKVPESQAWQQHREHSIGGILRTVRNFGGHLLFLVLMMTLFMFLSHGTQDLYPQELSSDIRKSRRRDCYSLQHRSGGRIDALRRSLTAHRPSLRNYLRTRACLRGYPDVGIRLDCPGPDHRRNFDAGRSSGRMGRDSRTSERDRA